MREANLGFEATVSKKYYDEAKVGTTVRWGNVTNLNSGTARVKSEGNSGNDITYDANTEGSVTLTINQHQYQGFELEEFEASLSIIDQQMYYTRRAAYAVNLAIDDTLAALIDDFGTSPQGTLAVDLTDDDIKRALQALEDANIWDGRENGGDLFFGMAPATKNSMLSIDRYASSDFNRGGGANIITGEFGNIYGARSWVSTNIEGSNAAGHDNGMWHRDAIALGMRMQPRTRVFDDIQNLSTQVAISAIWGVIETRDDHGVWLRGA